MIGGRGPRNPGGTKHDEGKPRYDLVPWDAMEEVAKVFRDGGEKYGERNWEKGLTWGRLIRAAFSHLSAFARGENTDSEWGHSHLAHAACCVLMLLAYVLRNQPGDDRILSDEEPT